MKIWIKTLGSLSLALFLIAVLAGVLVVSTLLESAYGTPFVQRFFYQAGWFDVFLAFFGVNIFCSALSRWPYKKQHTGFVVTHIGILMLLAGSLLTRLASVEGQMALAEGEAKSFILLQSAIGPSREKTGIFEGKTDDPPNHAVQFTLNSEAIGYHDTLWLVENDPSGSESDEIAMGAALMQIRPKAPARGGAASEDVGAPAVKIVQEKTAKEYLVRLWDAIGKEIPLGDSGLKIKNLRYFPDARVSEEKKLISVSDHPSNPAVEFEIEDEKGQKELHTKFALFPNFESLHGRNPQSVFGISVELLVPAAKAAAKTQSGSLIFYYEPDGKWSYESKSKKGKQEGSLEAGQSYSTGWMDFSFRVEKLLNRAVVHAPKLKTAPLPFKLALRDFRKVDYPGTSNAASYESDVTLEDAKEGLMMRKTISMNHPLDYKGYRIFQSSFSQDPELGETSVFTIAKNPGIHLIYSGAAVMFLGVILVFYVRPFSSFNNGGAHVRKK